jgi:hypothetical protein
MYTPVLVIHSLLRWAVLVLGLLAVVRAVAGWTGRRAWIPADKKAGLFFMISVDVQLLLGLLLYGVLSPITTLAVFPQFGAAMRVRELRFWAVEHLTAMLLAVIAVHTGRIAARRAPDAAAMHRRAALWFGLALLLILAGIPWPFLPYGRPLIRFG